MSAIIPTPRPPARRHRRWIGGLAAVAVAPVGFWISTSASDAPDASSSVRLEPRAMHSTVLSASDAGSAGDASTNTTPSDSDGVMGLRAHLTDSIAAGEVDGIVVYDDALGDGFQDWSWAAANDLASTEIVSSGDRAIRTDLGRWGALSLGHYLTLDAPDSGVLRFDVHGGANRRLALDVVVMDDEFQAGPKVRVDIRPDEWTTVAIPLDQLGVGDAIGGVWLQEADGRDPGPIHVDEIAIVAGDIGTPATTTPATTTAPTTTPTTTTTSVPATTTTTPPTTAPPPSGQWAFEETFDGDPDAPSQDLLPRNFDYVATHRSHPQDHFSKTYTPFLADHADDCAGPNPEVSPLPQHLVETRQDSNGSNPDESFFICKNHMMSSMGDVEGYSVSAFWPRQEFDFSDGGLLEFEVNINDAHAVRSWWEVMIVPRDQLKVGAGPVDSPISETYPDDRIVLDFRRNVRTIKVGTGALAPDGWLANDTQRGEYDFAWWRNLHPDDAALDDRRIRRTMQMRFENDRIVWGIETADGSFDEWSVDVPGGLPFDRGLVLFKTHAYNPTKDGNTDTYTFHWDNIRFDGPQVGFYDVHEADDVVYLQRNGPREIGENQTVTIDIDELGPNPVLFGQIHQPKRGQVLLSINGGPDIAVDPYEYERDDCVADNWKSFRLPLDPAQLRSGENTLRWTIGPRPDCVTGDIAWDGFSVKFLQIQTDAR